jgi:hypothetical protein
VLFLAYSGTATWRTRAGEEVTATLGEPLTVEQTAAAWRTALDPAGDWMPAVLQAADRRLSQVRAGGMPDAGAMVIASDHKAAKALRRAAAGPHRPAPVVVLSDDPAASEEDRGFDGLRRPVAGRGADGVRGRRHPRLAVGVYATSTQTPLFFAQAVGRFVRARKPGETASVFLPSVPSLLAWPPRWRSSATTPSTAGTGAVPRRLSCSPPANRALDEAGEEEPAVHLAAGLGHLDRVIYDGGEYGTGGSIGSDDELEYLGLPGCSSPTRCARC